MDPLSIIASSIAVAQAAHVAIKAVKASRNGGEEIFALHNEVSDLLVVLRELQTILYQRGASTNSLPPIAGLSSAVESAHSKLEQLIYQLNNWTDNGNMATVEQPKTRLRLIRIGRQAKKFREELRNIKERLWSVLRVVSISSSNRIEIDLKQIMLLAEHVAETNDEFHTFMRDRVVTTQDRETMSGDSSSDSTIAEHIDSSIPTGQADNHMHFEEFNVGTTRALQHNGKILFESNQLTAIAAVGIRTAHLPRTACTPWCSCVCHQETRIRTPKFLEQLTGALFIGYSGLPRLTKNCNEESCHLRAEPKSYVTYFFPQWFLARAVSVVMTTTPLAGPVLSLKVQRTVPGSSEIFTHAKLGNVNALKSLFLNGSASPHDVHHGSGITALHLATSYRQLEVCKFLLQMNADPFLEDRSQWTAADNAWNKILSRSLPPQTEQALRLMFSETECIERREFTILHKIVLGLIPNDLEQQLAASTADINALDNNGRSPISLASERGDINAVSALLRYGADSQIGSNCDATPLHYAGCATEPCCLQPLLDHGAAVDAITNWNQTPLIYVAAYTRDARHAQILLAAEAEKDYRDRDGITPLAWCAISDNAPVAHILLEYGSAIDTHDESGNTALSQCVSANRGEILRELVAWRASPILRISSGETILHLAARHATLETMEILRCCHDLSLVDSQQADAKGLTAEDVFLARSDDSSELRAAFDALLTSSDQSAAEGDARDDGSESGAGEIWADASEVQEEYLG